MFGFKKSFSDKKLSEILIEIEQLKAKMFHLEKSFQRVEGFVYNRIQRWKLKDNIGNPDELPVDSYDEDKRQTDMSQVAQAFGGVLPIELVEKYKKTES